MQRDFIFKCRVVLQCGLFLEIDEQRYQRADEFGLVELALLLLAGPDCTSY